jgi:uncharacterized protein YacL
MNPSTLFFRLVFTCLSMFFFIALSASIFPSASSAILPIIGIALGVFFSLVLFGVEFFFRQLSLKSLNTITLGLFFGYLFGQTIILVLSGLFEFSAIVLEPSLIVLCKGILFLAAIYFGLTITARASEEVYISIPFIKFKPNLQKKQDVLLDYSILADSRLIDLAASGLLDNQILIPRFILKEIYELVESTQELHKNRARRSLEIIKKLESFTSLEIRYTDTDFPEIQDSHTKIIRLARVLDASILTADMSQIDQSSVEGIRIININSIAKGLKPLTHTGEYINIKVQRYGKEARQGVGYLDDGTMVVINGGAEYIGEAIKAQVLSVKHTSSGRMIFCNAMEEGMLANQQLEENLSKFENAPKSYFAL